MKKKTKLGDNKKEVRIVQCYFGVVIVIGIILTIWLFCTFFWFFAGMGTAIYWFLVMSPLYGEDFFEVGSDNQRDKQNKKYAYKKKRGWE